MENIRMTLATVVINLDRRPDRLSLIERDLGGLGLSFERIEATDGMEIAGTDTAPLSASEYACKFSHIRASKYLLESRQKYLLVFEDDATPSRLVTRNSASLLRALGDLTNWMASSGTNLLQVGHIEHLYSASKRSGLAFRLIEIAIGKRWDFVTVYGKKLLVWRSQFRAGAHAYIIDRKIAMIIAKQLDAPLPIDDFFTSVAHSNVGYSREGVRIACLEKSLFGQRSRAKKSLRLDSDIK
jgi:hypothetical protein